jgi:hypothetical protein
MNTISRIGTRQVKSFLFGVLTTCLLASVFWSQSLMHVPTTSDGYPQPAVSSSVTAAPYNPRTALPNRLAEAVFVATQLRRTNSYTQLICPKEQQLGERPADHIPTYIGTPCEAWQNRELMEVLWNFFDSTMVGVEWSSGSGTDW